MHHRLIYTPSIYIRNGLHLPLQLLIMPNQTVHHTTNHTFYLPSIPTNLESQAQLLLLHHHLQRVAAQLQRQLDPEVHHSISTMLAHIPVAMVFLAMIRTLLHLKPLRQTQITTRAQTVMVNLKQSPKWKKRK